MYYDCILTAVSTRMTVVVLDYILTFTNDITAAFTLWLEIHFYEMTKFDEVRKFYYSDE